MGHFMEAKMLALSALILTITSLILMGTIFLPFWFKLFISADDATYGSEARRENYVIPCGLFFITTDKYQDMIFLNKVSNHMFAPITIVAGQVLYFSGTVGILACTAAAFVLAFRKIGSVVGEFFLAGFTTASSICIVLGVILSAFTFLNLDVNTWSKLPMNKPDRISGVVSPTSIEIDWAFFIAIIGAVLTIVAVALTWIEAFKTCRYIEDIRDKQLRDPDYGKHQDIQYTRFQYSTPHPEPYQVTVPSAQPTRPVYYGEPEEYTQRVEVSREPEEYTQRVEVSRQVEI